MGKYSPHAAYITSASHTFMETTASVWRVSCNDSPQDRCNHCVHIYYPESGQIYIERLCGAAIFQSQIDTEAASRGARNGQNARIAQDSRIHAESSAAGPFGSHYRIQAGGDGAPAISARKTRSNGNPRTYGGRTAAQRNASTFRAELCAWKK